MHILDEENRMDELTLDDDLATQTYIIYSKQSNADIQFLSDARSEKIALNSIVMAANKKLDAIIFGATGFTGQIVVEDALDILKDFKWGIAGRNEVGDMLQYVTIEFVMKLSNLLSLAV